MISICEEPVEVNFMTPVLNELGIKGRYCGCEDSPKPRTEAVKIMAEIN